MLRVILSVFMCLVLNVAFADVQITVQSDGAKSKISSDGKKARFSRSGQEGYLVFDLKKNKMLLVDTQKKQAYEIPLSADGEAFANPYKDATFGLEKKAKGPKTVGYKTPEYSETFDLLELLQPNSG